MMLLPPLGVYVHLPWCVSKCPYCDFNSHAAPAELPQKRYVEALIEDLECERPFVSGRKVETIFFGGGTPSLFSPENIAEIVEGITRNLSCAPNVEVTL